LKNNQSNQFFFVEEGPGRGLEDIVKECNVKCFYLFIYLFMHVMSGKIPINLIELH